MIAHEVIEKLTRAIPREIEWSSGESYGPFNIDRNTDIQKILYCVTPTPEVIDYFYKNHYDLLISHHPYVKRVPQIILHTALDCCAGGLNDQWRDALGIKNAKHFDGTLGWYGEIEPTSFASLVKRCEAFMGHQVQGQVYSTIEIVRSVVVCSGLGGLVTDLARKTNADCYIFGEATQKAKDMGFKAIIETGHTISEQIGVYLIREVLPELQVDLAPLEIDYFGREVYKERKKFDEYTQTK